MAHQNPEMKTGNIIVIIEEKKHKLFKRVGQTLFLDLDISL